MPAAATEEVALERFLELGEAWARNTRRSPDSGSVPGRSSCPCSSSTWSERVPSAVDQREDVDLSPLGGANIGKVADHISIGLVDSAHGTHVAGIIAGNGTLGGAGPARRRVSAASAGADIG